MPFKDYAARYIANRRRCLTDNTLDQYNGSLERHLNPRIGSRKIGTFTPGVLEDLLSSLESDRVGLASQKNAYLVLKLVMDAARHRGALTRDPLLDIAAPVYVPDEVSIPTHGELQAIRASANDDDLRLVIELMAGCGLRNGEAHAANLKSIVADDVYRVTEQILGKTVTPAALKHRRRREFREVPLPRKTHAFTSARHTAQTRTATSSSKGTAPGTYPSKSRTASTGTSCPAPSPVQPASSTNGSKSS